jgi:hypothetical protein
MFIEKKLKTELNNENKLKSSFKLAGYKIITFSLLSETKINYWFKHLLNCNISAILVAIIKLINISKEKLISYYLIRYIKQKN